MKTTQLIFFIVCWVPNVLGLIYSIPNDYLPSEGCSTHFEQYLNDMETEVEFSANVNGFNGKNDPFVVFAMFKTIERALEMTCDVLEQESETYNVLDYSIASAVVKKNGKASLVKQVESLDRVYAMYCICKTSATTAQLNVEDMVFSSKFEHGYLDDTALEEMALHIVFCLFYIFLFGYYMTKRVKHGKPLSKVQMLVSAFIFTGFLHEFISFVQLEVANTTGNPLCCPLSASVVIVQILSALKIHGLLIMLLLISLGFGVVHTRLPKRVSVIVIVLAAFSTIASVLRAIFLELSYTSSGIAAQVELFFSIIIIFWTFYALSRTKRSLREKDDQIKLSMYNSLSCAIAIAFLALILPMVIFSLIKRPSKESFFSFLFYEIIAGKSIFFCLVAYIARLWLPSDKADQYRPASLTSVLLDNVDNDEVDMREIEISDSERDGLVVELPSSLSKQ